MITFIWFICGLIGAVWYFSSIKRADGYITMGDLVICGPICTLLGPVVIGIMIGITFASQILNSKWWNKRIL